MRHQLGKVGLCAVAFVMVQCGSSERQSSVTTLRIDGSSTVYPITEAVAEEFQKQHPDVRITIGVSGTGGGFKKFCNGEVHITNASRPIAPGEVSNCSGRGLHFIELPVAYDGLAVVVHPDNTWVDKLSLSELRRIWESAAQGKITNWNQVRPGFPDMKLQLFGPGTDSGTFEYFTEAVMGERGNSRGDYTASEDDNVLVQGVNANPGALGYFGIAYYLENHEKLKLVPIDDENEANGTAAVTPSEQTVQDGTYGPLARALYLYVRQEDTIPEIVNRFVDFYLEHVNTLAREVGYIPLQAELMELVKLRWQNKVSGTMYPDGKEVGTNLKEKLQGGT
ncbi:MAG: PstS family phosphate ABC transporter substrate-binding protein [Chitinophagales bacterium]|nr:PstS family phosphate ABC transporter substrate-binding protein [Chitinophagales bacterium]MDW8428420.1 PstS family phosphate ABC transporter substrate-binding protein [Chitinophagales bacterium]